MAAITNSTSKFPAELSKEIFAKTKGHSSLARLSGQTPIPFSGTDIFTFTLDGEAAIVGEGENKPAGDATVAPAQIKPIKFLYQHRLTDEFVKMSEEKQIPYLDAFTEGFAKKIARALDIAAIHGVNPATGTASDTIGNKCFDKAVTTTVTYDAVNPDECIDDAVTALQAVDGEVSGIAFSKTMASAIGKQKTGGTGAYRYPEYRFGANPGVFGGMAADNNSTVSFGNSKDRAVIGDFANAFKWGYSEDIPLEIIEYGDPDGQGDLKRMNQIVLRAETYIGWGILDPSSFARIVEAES